MTSLGETYEKLMKFIRFFVNRAPALRNINIMETNQHVSCLLVSHEIVKGNQRQC